MAYRPVWGDVLMPACSCCDAEDCFMEKAFAAALKRSVGSRSTARISAA